MRERERKKGGRNNKKSTIIINIYNYPKSDFVNSEKKNSLLRENACDFYLKLYFVLVDMFREKKILLYFKFIMRLFSLSTSRQASFL